jgi:hypothetical protein
MCKRSAGAMRKLLQSIEGGVCRGCGLDTVQLLSRLQCRHRSERVDVILDAAPHWGKTKGTKEAAKRLGARPNPGARSVASCHVRAYYTAECCKALASAWW